MAVTVVVDKCATGAPSRRVRIQQSGFFGHIGESPVTVVAVKVDSVRSTSEEVFEAVVVVVPNADADGPVHRRNPRLLRHVGKGAIVIVFVQAVACIGRRAFQRVPLRRKISIQPSLS